MNAMIQKLGDWGCDIPGALERLVDDEELYTSCLRLFAEEEGFATLDTCIATGAYDEAFDAAHTLKGVAANLGLTPIFMPVSNLVEALRAQKYDVCPELNQKVQEAFRHYCSLIQ